MPNWLTMGIITEASVIPQWSATTTMSAFNLHEEYMIDRKDNLDLLCREICTHSTVTVIFVKIFLPLILSQP